MLRRLLVVGVCAVLVITLFGANLVWAADRGPLNADRVTDSAEEAGLYAEVQQELVEALGEEEISLPYPGLEDRADEIIALIVTDDWIQAESERNIHNIYAHLQDDEPLDVYVDFIGHQDHIETTFRNEFRLGDLEIERLDRLMASEESYLDERGDLRTSLLAEIGVDPDDGFGVATIQGLLESPESYEETRADVRGDIADEAMAELEADRGFGNDRMAGMYEDPDTYEQEQIDFREGEKERIQEETDRELSDEELEEHYEEQQDEIIDGAADEARDRIELDDAPDTAQDRVEDLAVLKAEALADETVTHDEFTDRYDAIVADIEDDVIADVEENTEDYEDDIDEQVRAEMDEADVPKAIESEVHGVADVTVTAITTDMTYEEYGAAYDDAVADVEAAAVEHVSENREEYDDELEAAMGDTGLDDVPPSIEPETDAIIDLILEAVVTEMAYDPFMAELDEREEDLATALAGALFEEEMIPERLEFTDELTTEAGDELELAGDLMGLVTPIALGLTGLALALVGGIFAIARDLGTTALASGVSALIVGVPSFAVASIVPDIVHDAMADIDVQDGLRDASVEMLELVIFSPLEGQGLLLIGLGGVLIGAGIALRLELISVPGGN